LAAVNVLLTGVPDYTWYGGCFGTASGNLMAYWDRHGFPDFYTGPTVDETGLAPLNSNGTNFNIRSLWTSRAGVDGRPNTEPGHEDDYWQFFESTDSDPYELAGRAEHAPDCLGDFIGLSQRKWSGLPGGFDGNIDGFAWIEWDLNGERRWNHRPAEHNGTPLKDFPSGLRAWTEYRGGAADVFSQVADFNPKAGAGRGFTFDDLKAEIDAGYPVVIYLQEFAETSRFMPSGVLGNPNAHAMLAFGYYITDSGDRFVRYKTSWGGSGENTISRWNSARWQAQLPVFGFIGYHPQPKIRSITSADGQLTFRWDGPVSELRDLTSGETRRVHQYVIEESDTLGNSGFNLIAGPTSERTLSIPVPASATAFYRVRLLPVESTPPG
jgi:hypothetical protein